MKTSHEDGSFRFTIPLTSSFSNFADRLSCRSCHTVVMCEKEFYARKQLAHGCCVDGGKLYLLDRSHELYKHKLY